MKRHIPLLCAAISLLAVAACTAAPKTLPPGEYESSSTSVNQSGTETKESTKTNVYYDEYGNKRAVQETETSSDPKGLFNKSTSTTTKTY